MHRLIYLSLITECVDLLAFVYLHIFLLFMIYLKFYSIGICSFFYIPLHKYAFVSKNIACDYIYLHFK